MIASPSSSHDNWFFVLPYHEYGEPGSTEQERWDEEREEVGGDRSWEEYHKFRGLRALHKRR